MCMQFLNFKNQEIFLYENIFSMIENRRKFKNQVENFYSKFEFKIEIQIEISIQLKILNSGSKCKLHIFIQIIKKVVTSHFRTVIARGLQIIKAWGVTTEHWTLSTLKWP